jgi:hypothetical protein
MRNTCRRIEALEKATSVKRDLELQIGERAMGSLWPNDAEELLRAYGAERAGRPLTESEAEAKKKLAEAVARECGWAGIP